MGTAGVNLDEETLANHIGTCSLGRGLCWVKYPYLFFSEKKIL